MIAETVAVVAGVAESVVAVSVPPVLVIEPPEMVTAVSVEALKEPRAKMPPETVSAPGTASWAPRASVPALTNVPPV